MSEHINGAPLHSVLLQPNFLKWLLLSLRLRSFGMKFKEQFGRTNYSNYALIFTMRSNKPVLILPLRFRKFRLIFRN
jgi:hypothetical protein